MSRLWNSLVLLAGASEEQVRQNRRQELCRRKMERNIHIDRLISNDWQFTENYRLSKDEFRVLCYELKHNTSLRDSSISLELKVLTTLSFYAMGTYQKGVATSYNMDQRSVSNCIKEVTMALNESYMTSRWIKFPTTGAEKQNVKYGFYTKFGFPGVLGAVDCTHIAIVRPVQNEPCYFNRKGYHSLNTQMICDSGLRILNVNAKFGGASHDSHIWTSSVIKTHMEQLNQGGESVWLLGDSGYPQRGYLMTPISNTVPHSREERYNKLHVQARNCIERTFGVLKSRFRCLLSQRVLYYHPDYAAKMVIACSILHNMLLKSRGEPDLTDIELVAEEAIVAPNDDVAGLLVGRTIRDQLILRLFPN